MLSDNIIKQIKDWRQHLHIYPENAFEETQTADFIARVLTGLGLEVHRNIGGTGVVGNLKVGEGIAVIDLRADMDAINMQEIGESAYTSRYSDKMHA